MTDTTKCEIEFVKLEDDRSWPDWCSRKSLVRFLHQTMKPFEDSPVDIERSLDYAFSDEKRAGGFVMLGKMDDGLAGAVVMLRTGMAGYVPEYILLFISVDPRLRGMGIGGKLMRRCFAECDGEVKLHVESGNPAKHLYERMGITHVYDEMRIRL